VRATGRLGRLAEWAWARHHDVLSWYVRPLFLLPLAWSAHRRSPAGVAVTLVALATSMAWFPAPARVDPRVAEFLRFEREWLSGDRTGRKVLLAGLVPLSLTAVIRLLVGSGSRRGRTSRRHRRWSPPPVRRRLLRPALPACGRWPPGSGS
jgi:hypothetical protein